MTSAEQTAYEEFAREASLAPESDWDRYDRWCAGVPWKGKGAEMLLRAFWHLMHPEQYADTPCEALEWIEEFIEREHQLVVPEW